MATKNLRSDTKGDNKKQGKNFKNMVGRHKNRGKKTVCETGERKDP